MNFYDNITEFIFVEDIPLKSDIIFVPGGGYGEIAVNAAKLYHRGIAEYIMPSGKHSILKEKFEGPISPVNYKDRIFPTECDYFSTILREEGVPECKILRERKATYTYENAIYSKQLVEERGIRVNKAVISCKAYHARRCLMYYQLLFPTVDFYISAVETEGINKTNWYLEQSKIDLVLDEVERCGSQFHKIMKEKITIE